MSSMNLQSTDSGSVHKKRTPTVSSGLIYVCVMFTFAACSSNDDDDQTIDDQITQQPGDDDVSLASSPSPAPSLPPSPTPDSGDDDSPASSPTPSPDFHIFRVIPTTTAWAVSRSALMEVWLSEKFYGAESEIGVQLVDGFGTSVSISSHLDSARERLIMDADTLLENTSYTLSLQIDEGWTEALAATSQFTTRIPCGVTFNAGYSISVLKFGGDQKATTIINSTLGQLPQYIAMVFYSVTGTSTFPLSDMVVPLGAYDGGTLAMLDAGFNSALQTCAISESGNLDCGPEPLVIPLDLNADVSFGPQPLYVQGVVLEATASASGAFEELTFLSLSGYVTREDLLQFAEDSNMVDEISSLAKYDRDSDGDGSNDAVSLQVTTEPVPLTLYDCL